MIGAMMTDLGGDPDQLSEGQRQLCRRAAGLSLECERLEAMACGAPSAIEEEFRENAGGLSLAEILGECARLVHWSGRHKGGEGARQLAALRGRRAVDHVVDLLIEGGRYREKAASAGAERAMTSSFTARS